MSFPNQLSSPNTGIPIQEILEKSSLRIRSVQSRHSGLLLDMPIARRLALGFLVAALIASLVTGIVGAQRSQSLSRQSDFYQNLLRTNTDLTTGNNFLVLMNIEVHQLMDTEPFSPSSETFTTMKNAMIDLSTRYDVILTHYITQDLVNKHPAQLTLLSDTNRESLTQQQTALSSSALRTWRVYRLAQQQILQLLSNGRLEEARILERVQGEPTNADTQSALRSLIQFNQSLASSVQNAANQEEQNQLLTTVLGAIFAFIVIALLGWLISNTLVQRLQQLRRVTQAVENGQLDARVTVVGRDEIADVSASVNAMLQTIVGLLEETRRQRDALTNAAEHLFSDMRVVSAGDLRVNASVSNDPIGMLANAFNFTVSRFRRFVQRTQSTVEQLTVISRQEIERTENFAQTMHQQINLLPAELFTNTGEAELTSDEPIDAQDSATAQKSSTKLHVQRAREQIQKLAEEYIAPHTSTILQQTEQARYTINRLKMLINRQLENKEPQISLDTLHLYSQELRNLESSLMQATAELQLVQKRATDGLKALDANLQQITIAMHVQRSRTTLNPLLQNGARAQNPDALKISLNFANEINTLARQLTAIAQEMRVGVIAFQLDGRENNAIKGHPTQSPQFSPIRQSLPTNSQQNVQQPLVPRGTRSGVHETSAPTNKSPQSGVSPQSMESMSQ